MSRWNGCGVPGMETAMGFVPIIGCLPNVGTTRASVFVMEMPSRP